MSKKPNFYFLVVTEGHFYCVASKDVKTVDASLVKEDDVIAFKYGSLSLSGVVRFVSTKEKEVLDQIKKGKKTQKKSQRSFHDDQPRESALRAMEGMRVKRIKTEPDDQSACRRADILTAKRHRDQTKAVAKDVTEKSLIDDSRLGSSLIIKGPCDLDLDTDSGKSVLENSSSSSIDPNSKVDEEGKKSDIKALKVDSDDSANATSVNDAVSKKVYGNSSRSSSPVRELRNGSPNSSPLRVPGNCSRADSPDLISTIPIEDNGTETWKPGSPQSCSSISNSSAGKRHSRDRSCSLSSSDSNDKRFRRKRRHFSSTSSSSSSSESSSSESSSEESSSSEEDRKKKKKHRSRKKSKHHRRSKKSKKAKKARSKKIKDKPIKRNIDIYPGPNFKWKHDDEGVVKKHDEFEVYVLKNDLHDALNQSKSPHIFIKAMVGHVFTLEALKGSTAQGYPSRHKGKKKLRQRALRAEEQF